MECGWCQCTEEERGDHDLGGPSSVAEAEIVSNDGNEPLAWAIDDTRSHYPCSIAAESHGHGEGLLAMRPRAPEEFVEVKGNPWQVAEILQQRE